MTRAKVSNRYLSGINSVGNDKTSAKVGASIFLEGVVQGVGFRPFVHRLANVYCLTGWVLNSTGGLIIEVEGKKEKIEKFYQSLFREAPPLAYIRRQEIKFHVPHGYSSFTIKESIEETGKFVLISPDIATCEDCLQEMFNLRDRRYLYPFINCTNCGPRFTIIEDVPYDRQKTTMKRFKMCLDCEEEYHTLSYRRYHAEPNACPHCGPQLYLVEKEESVAKLSSDGKDSGEIIRCALSFLQEGKILAIKGLGGFHLACDAENDEAVCRLRELKGRESKPLAIMSRDVFTIQTYCYVTEAEKELLESPRRPIVLLRKKEPCSISDWVAYRNRYLGVMLPYTPLHYLLLQNFSRALVMTSGNFSEEPMVIDEKEAQRRLSPVADYFLFHNRPIKNRCDDSVVRIIHQRSSIARRARGYVPFPIILKEPLRPILACGAELKNTFCVTRDHYAFLSQHIGDLKNWETYEFYCESIDHFQKFFRINPELVAHDLHPEYLSTRYAHLTSVPKIAVQHHHAHIKSCLAENQAEEPVIGVAFDGAGLGTDGNIWGGEFLLVSREGFERLGHFEYLPLPGGDAAAREPYRMAISYLYQLYGRDFMKQRTNFNHRIQTLYQDKVEVLLQMLGKKINTPLTSSCGRLFDAISSLCGVCDISTYEGQAAMELEATADENEKNVYPYLLKDKESKIIIGFLPLIEAVLEDLNQKIETSRISARFHRTLVRMIVEVCSRLRDIFSLNRVALSGGVFQNRLLSEWVLEELVGKGFIVYYHSQVPANDGGISLGQAVIAHEMAGKGGK